MLCVCVRINITTLARRGNAEVSDPTDEVLEITTAFLFSFLVRVGRLKKCTIITKRRRDILLAVTRAKHAA